MNAFTTKSSLPPPRRLLIELMQRLNFGRIEQLVVRRGEPIFDPAPRVIQKLKMGGENGPRTELACDDFLLKKHALEFFAAVSELEDGSVLSIDVKHGLPFAVEVQLACAGSVPLEGQK